MTATPIQRMDTEKLSELKEQVEKKLEEFHVRKQLRLLENLSAMGDGWGSFVDPLNASASCGAPVKFRSSRRPRTAASGETGRSSRMKRNWP